MTNLIAIFAEKFVMNRKLFKAPLIKCHKHETCSDELGMLLNEVLKLKILQTEN